MTDIDNSLLDSFLNWLFGLDDNDAVSLPKIFKDFRETHKTEWKGMNKEARKSLGKTFNTQLQENKDAQKEFLQFLELFGVDKDLVKDVEELSKAYGDHFLTGYRGANPFGSVKKDVKALKDRVNKYKEKVEKLYSKSDASMEKIVEIKRALLLAKQIDNKIANIESNDHIKNLNDDKEKKRAIELAKKDLQKQRDEVIKDAAKYRTIDRPLSLVGDIERELKNTLSREERKYASLTGKSIEVKIDNGTIKAEKVDAFKKLNDTITAIDALDELSKYLSPKGKNGVEVIIDKEEIEKIVEKVPPKLRLSIFGKEIIDEKNNEVKDGASCSIENLGSKHFQKIADGLINESKNMRSLDHRAGQTRGLILAELKWTNNRNTNQKSEEERLLKEATQDIGKYTKRLKKAQVALNAVDAVHRQVSETLKSLSGINLVDNLKLKNNMNLQSFQVKRESDGPARNA